MSTITTVNDIKSLGTILGVWAHPDDEVFSMSGIMAAAVQNGQTVVCVTATRGELGIQNESRWPASILGEIRTKELAESYKILGVTHHHWLEYPDGGCSAIPDEVAASKVCELIKQYKPDSIFTFGPDGLTGHPDHQAVSHWASVAAQQAGSSARIFHVIQTYEQYKSMLKADETLNVYFNIELPHMCEECDCDVCFCLTNELYDLKLKALAAMPSQTEKMLQQFGDDLKDALCKEAFVLAENNSTND